MKKVLLTGGSGFIGQQTIPFLLDRGFEVHAIFNSSEKKIFSQKNLYWHQCDLLNSAEQQKVFTLIKPSHLLNLARYAVPGKYWESEENHKWLNAGIEIMKNFAEQGGIRAVFAGSSAEYDWSYGVCNEENTPLKPSSTYGTCKKTLLEELKRFSDQSGIGFAWGRVFLLYGPHEYSERLVASFIYSLLKNKEAYCFNGKLIRDFLHVRDVASAFISLLESNFNGAINIASGNPAAIKDVVIMIGDILGKRKLINFTNNSASVKEPEFLIADVKLLNSEIGWFPEYTLDKGLTETIDWYKNNMN